MAYCIVSLGNRRMVNVRRSEFEIIREILMLSRHGTKRTEILYQCNLSYTQLQKYLPFLIERDIMEEQHVKNNGNSGKLYKITQKGLTFLEDIDRVLVHFG